MQKTKVIAIKQDYRAVQHLSFVLLLAVVVYLLLESNAHAGIVDSVPSFFSGGSSSGSSSSGSSSSGGTDTVSSTTTSTSGSGSSSSIPSSLLDSSGNLSLPTTTTGFMALADGLFSGLNSPMEEVLCTILLIILGDAGRGIATLAVMGMGIGAMMGKVSWGQAMTVAVWIGIMFGAPLILPLILFDPSGAISGVVSGASSGGLSGMLSGAVSGGGLGVACF